MTRNCPLPALAILWKILWESTPFAALTKGNKGTYNEMTQSAANWLKCFRVNKLGFNRTLTGQHIPQPAVAVPHCARFPQLYPPPVRNYIWCGP